MSVERARTAYEQAVYGGDVSGLAGAERDLDAAEADIALARGRILHARFRAFLAWLDRDRDVTVAGAGLFVHPDTIRHRVRRFAEVTGIDPAGPNDWWLCRSWLDEAL